MYLLSYKSILPYKTVSYNPDIVIQVSFNNDPKYYL